MTSPYGVTSSGELQAELPSQCPQGCAGSACEVRAHHRRKRQCGPGFALTVAQCRHHGGGFTVYPLGWVPFGRQPISVVSPEGYAAVGGDEEVTLWSAARDVARGRWWPRSGAGPSEGVLRTQLRRLAWAGRLLGLSASTGARERERVGEVLAVGQLSLREAAGRYAGRSWRSRGQAVCDVLSMRSARGRTLDGLLRAGHRAGLWGRPSRWDPGGGGRLRPLI